jgi:hypothetical protein
MGRRTAHLRRCMGRTPIPQVSNPILLHDLGFSDLVQVIPPGVELSPHTKVAARDRGKAPGHPTPAGWTGTRGWIDIQPDRSTVLTWLEQGSNLGLHGRRFPGIDIDIDDEQLAEIACVVMREHFGTGPVRLSRGSRRLFVVRTDEPFGKIKLTATRDGVTHAIEVLGDGQQYLVYGTHPSGELYRWDGRPLEAYTPGEIPLVTRGQVIAALRAFGELVGHKWEIKITGTGELKDRTAVVEYHPWLLAPSIEELRETVAKVPNPAGWGWDEMVRFGYAIKAAAGPEHLADALEIFLEWESRWEAGNKGSDPELMTQKFLDMAPKGSVGWPYVQSWVPATEEFASDPTLMRIVSEMDAERLTHDSGALSDALDAINYVKHVPFEDPAIPSVLRRISEKCSAIPDPGQRAYAEALLLKGLERHVGRYNAAHVLQSITRADDRLAPFVTAAGKQLLRMADARELDPRKKYLVDGMIPAGSVGELIAGWGCGKTWLLIELVMSVAFGVPFFGRHVMQGPVLYLAYEGRMGLWMRFAGWLVRRGYLPARYSMAELNTVLEGRVYVAAAPPGWITPHGKPG